MKELLLRREGEDRRDEGEPQGGQGPDGRRRGHARRTSPPRSERARRGKVAVGSPAVLSFSVASEITTAPASASRRPPTPRTMCQAGRASLSSSTRAPIVIATTGFATDTVATEGASFPVPSETCCTTKAAMPVRAIAYASQSVRTAPIPSCRVSTVGFARLADSPKRIPAANPYVAALRVSEPRPPRNIEDSRRARRRTTSRNAQSEAGASSTPLAGSAKIVNIASPATMTAAPRTSVRPTCWLVRKYPRGSAKTTVITSRGWMTDSRPRSSAAACTM